MNVIGPCALSLSLCIVQYYILMSDDSEKTHEKEPECVRFYVHLCVALSYLPFSSFYKDYIFFECGRNNLFMVECVLLLIGSHCECVFRPFVPLHPSNFVDTH